MSSSSPDAVAGPLYVEPAGTASRSLARPRIGRVAGLARRAAVPLALVLAWQAAAWLGWLDPGTLASPVQVWHAFTDTWSSGELWPSIVTSLRRVIVGLAIGVSIGTG